MAKEKKVAIYRTEKNHLSKRIPPSISLRLQVVYHVNKWRPKFKTKAHKFQWESPYRGTCTYEARAKFIESEKLNSNRDNIEVYVVNLDVFWIGIELFAFNEMHGLRFVER